MDTKDDTLEENDVAVKAVKRPNPLQQIKIGRTLNLLTSTNSIMSPRASVAKIVVEKAKQVNYLETQVTEFINVLRPGQSPEYPEDKLSDTINCRPSWLQIRSLIKECCVNYDFAIESSININKKRQKLSEILSFVARSTELKNCEISDLIVLCNYNLFRNYFERVDQKILEDDDDIKDISWLHVWPVYQTLMKLCSGGSKKLVAEFLTYDLINMLSHQLQSYDRRERSAVMDLLQYIYRYYPNARNDIRMVVTNILVSIIYDSYSFVGVKELVLVSQEFPIKKFVSVQNPDSTFILNVLIPLQMKLRKKELYEPVLDVINAYITKDLNYIAPIIQKLLRHWKKLTIEDSLALIVQLDEIMQNCPISQLNQVGEKIVLKLIDMLKSINQDIIADVLKLLLTQKLLLWIQDNSLIKSNLIEKLESIKKRSVKSPKYMESLNKLMNKLNCSSFTLTKTSLRQFISQKRCTSMIVSFPQKNSQVSTPAESTESHSVNDIRSQDQKLYKFVNSVAVVSTMRTFMKKHLF